MRMRLELVPLPVADIDRAKEFYVERMGFTEDLDVRVSESVRVCQLTPEGSACSINLSEGLPHLAERVPGSVKGLHLVVEDIVAVRDELIRRGVTVGPVDDQGGGMLFAGLSDPDGNTWALQQMPQAG